MIQFKTPASEYLCDECSEAIINPLCPYCLTIEVEAWLTYYPNLRSELLPRIYNYIHDADNQLNLHTRCIKCSSNSTFLCPYCFTEHVLDELKEIDANKIILQEFFEFFNFDFDHTGYYKEAEELGVV